MKYNTEDDEVALFNAHIYDAPPNINIPPYYSIIQQAQLRQAAVIASTTEIMTKMFEIYESNAKV